MPPVPANAPVSAAPVSPAPASIPLEYRTERPAGAARPVQWVFVLAGVAGLVAPFVPYTYGVRVVQVLWSLGRDPGMVWSDKESTITFLILCLPFFLPLPLWVLRLRGMLLGPATLGERLAAYAVGALMAAGTLIVLGMTVDEFAAMEWAHRLMLVSAAVVLVGGATALGLMARRGAHGHALACGALIVPYLANAVLCLVAFHENAQLGWYLTAFGAAAASAELVLLVIRPGRPA